MLLFAVFTYTALTSPAGGYSPLDMSYFINAFLFAYESTWAVAISSCFTPANPLLVFVYLYGFILSVLSMSLWVEMIVFALSVLNLSSAILANYLSFILIAIVAFA
jgi:hypothetical protein